MNDGEFRGSWLYKVQRIRGRWVLSLNKEFILSSPKLREFWERQGRKKVKSQKKGRRSVTYHLGKTQVLTSWSHSSCGCLNWFFTRMGLATVRHGWNRGSGGLTLISELFAIDKFREKGNSCFYLCTHWWLQQAPEDSFQSNDHRDGPDYMSQNERENMNLVKGAVGTRGDWLGWEGDPRSHKMGRIWIHHPNKRKNVAISFLRSCPAPQSLSCL